MSWMKNSQRLDLALADVGVPRRQLADSEAHRSTSGSPVQPVRAGNSTVGLRPGFSSSGSVLRLVVTDGFSAPSGAVSSLHARF